MKYVPVKIQLNNYKQKLVYNIGGLFCYEGPKFMVSLNSPKTLRLLLLQ